MNLAAPTHILSRFNNAVGEALARRGRALLDSAHLADEVDKLGTAELYFMIKELGVDEALPLLLAAGEGRLQSLCDFDCWDRDQLEPLDLDAWLAPFAQEGQEALSRAFLALDHEVQVLFLQGLLEVYEGAANDNPHIPEGRITQELPGQLMTLAYKDHEGELDPTQLVNALMAHSMEELFQLLTACTWELESTLMEQAYQFRANRMADLGFMERERAARLFAPPPKVLTGLLPSGVPEPQPLPAIYAAALTDEQVLLHRALSGITDSRDGARIESELVYLINGAVVAWDLTVRNLADVHDAALFVRNVLSLALEVLCGGSGTDTDFDTGDGDGDGASNRDARLVGTLLGTPLVHLFQRGMAEIMPLARQGQQLARHEAVQLWLQAEQDPGEVPSAEAKADAADRAFVLGLSAGRPYWGGSDTDRPHNRAMWRSQRELALSGARLATLQARWTPAG